MEHMSTLTIVLIALFVAAVLAVWLYVSVRGVKHARRADPRQEEPGRGVEQRPLP